MSTHVLASPTLSLRRLPHVTPVTLLGAGVMLIVSGAMLLTDGQIFGFLAAAS